MKERGDRKKEARGGKPPKRESIGELKREIARLKTLVYKDPLTKLYNRRGFYEEAEKMFVVAKRALERPGVRRHFTMDRFSIIFADLDHFKAVNDTYGHEAGDAALARVAKVLKRSVRESDIVARLGGEEFVVALLGADEVDAARIAEKTRERLAAEPVVWKRKRIPITASFGVACLKNGDTFTEIVEKADTAAYDAKRAGRNRVITWSEAGENREVSGK